VVGDWGELQTAIGRIYESAGWDLIPLCHGLVHIVEEVGEVAECLTQLCQSGMGNDQQTSQARLSDELADTVILVVEFATLAGISLSDRPPSGVGPSTQGETEGHRRVHDIEWGLLALLLTLGQISRCVMVLSEYKRHPSTSQVTVTLRQLLWKMLGTLSEISSRFGIDLYASTIRRMESISVRASSSDRRFIRQFLSAEIKHLQSLLTRFEERFADSKC